MDSNHQDLEGHLRIDAALTKMKQDTRRPVAETIQWCQDNGLVWDSKQALQHATRYAAKIKGEGRTRPEDLDIWVTALAARSVESSFNQLSDSAFELHTKLWAQLTEILARRHDNAQQHRSFFCFGGARAEADTDTDTQTPAEVALKTQVQTLFIVMPLLRRIIDELEQAHDATGPTTTETSQ